MDCKFYLRYFKVILGIFIDENVPITITSGTNFCYECNSDIINNEELFTTSCNHCFHLNCVQKWFSFNNTCPNCNKTLINHNTRIKHTKENYLPIKRDFTFYRFILYLFGSNLNREVDVNSMLKESSDEIIFENNIFEYIDLYSNFCAVILPLVVLYIALFNSNNIVSSCWIFIFLLFQIASFRIISFDMDIYKVFYFLNVENPFNYVNFLFTILVSHFLFVLISFVLFEDYTIKIVCKIKILYWLFYFLFLADVLRISIYNTLEFFKVKFPNLIKTEFKGTSNIFGIESEIYDEPYESESDESENEEFIQQDDNLNSELDENSEVNLNSEEVNLNENSEEVNLNNNSEEVNLNSVEVNLNSVEVNLNSVEVNLNLNSVEVNINSVEVNLNENSAEEKEMVIENGELFSAENINYIETLLIHESINNSPPKNSQTKFFGIW